ncbi:hypothetical protein M413DRAFT_256734 [Hebeloma cylindrosporum]|uniref:Uncharacterized protein n=1 Tax=Hebeloma cylindrosporum TaxID=76867 RepID=A0A0C3BM91_HEBCY|nr:hypothetical protein M413DRAFT_256734 [Hebeloma cylindrosporum h7]
MHINPCLLFAFTYLSVTFPKSSPCATLYFPNFSHLHMSIAFLASLIMIIDPDLRSFFLI